MTVSGRAIVILSVPIMEGDAEPKDWAWSELLGLTLPVLVMAQTMVDLLPNEQTPPEFLETSHPISNQLASTG